MNMNEDEIYRHIRQALSSAPRNQYTDKLEHITAKAFCEGTGLNQSLGTEFSKMRNLTHRLKAAGLNTDLL